MSQDATAASAVPPAAAALSAPAAVRAAGRRVRVCQNWLPLRRLVAVVR
jgi:hypothetical protein